MEKVPPRKWEVDEDIVISGIAGRFPLSNNVEEFRINLFTGRNMSTADDSRYPCGQLGLPLFSGKVKELDKLDTDFFGIPITEANFMDPQLRILLEVTYEAIVDSGTNPDTLRGTKTGFYYGSCFHEACMALGEDPMSVPGYLQNFETMVPFHLDLRGPICQYDTACASSLCAFNEAFTALKSNTCEQAIVAGFNICMPPVITLQFRDLQMISKEGLSKCMDAKADGFGRSEAVVSLYLQKGSQAKRAYASILNSRSNTDGHKEQGINFPSVVQQRKLMEAVYSETDINPNELEYIEAHTTGTQAGDPVELQAVAEVFCQNRKKPLKIGCLKSNMGHAEGASGLCAIAKAIIIFQNRKIPPNIQYHKPNPNIKGLMDGVLAPVTRVEPLENDIIPLNCFGFGGSNVHSILKRPSRSSSLNVTDTHVPRLLAICSRTQDGLQFAFDYVNRQRSTITAEFIHLTHQVSGLKKMPFRGYTIMDLNKQTEICGRHFAQTLDKPSPLIYLFSGNVGLSSTVTTDFLELAPIKASLGRSSELLSKEGFDVVHLFSSKGRFNKKGDALLYSVCLQLAIADLLSVLGLKPDNVMSYSHGEWIASYVKGTMSRDDVLTAASSMAKKATLLNGDTQKAFNIEDIVDSFDVKSTFENITNHTLSGALVLEIGTESISSPTEGVKWNLGSVENNNPYNSMALLSCLGHLYLKGHDLKLENLYTQITYPVPCETPSISPLIQWNHSSSLLVCKYPEYFNPLKHSATFNFRCNLNASEDWFFESHKIDGRVLFPATGYLMLIWAAIGRFSNSPVFDVKIEFFNVCFNRATFLSGTDTKFCVQILPTTGSFAVIESDTAVCTGKVRQVEKIQTPYIPPSASDKPEYDKSEMLKAEDIYKEFRVRGYDYGPYFQNLVEATIDGDEGKVVWRDTSPQLIKGGSSVLEKSQAQQWNFLRNWVPFADCALQLSLLANKQARVLLVPTKIEYLSCDPAVIQECLKQADKVELKMDKEGATKETPVLPIHYNKDLNIIYTEGFYAKGMKATMTTRKAQNPYLEKYVFQGYEEDCAMDEDRKAEIEHYYDMCLYLAEQLESARKRKKNGHVYDVQTNGFDLSESKYALYNKLLNELKAIISSKKVQTEEISCKLEEDLLSGFGHALYKEERFIRQLLEVSIAPAVYSGSAQKINITEFTFLKTSFCNTVCDIVEKITMGTNAINYTVVSDSRLDNELPNFAMKTDWDGSDANFPTGLQNQDFVIYNYNGSKVELELKQVLEKISKALKPGGFVLMLYTNDAPNVLNQKLLKLNVNPIQETLSHEGVMELASANNLIRVCKKDLHSKVISKSGALFRKPATYSHEIQDQKFLAVDLSSFGWVDSLKALLSDETQTERIWLTSSDRDNGAGLLGLVKCLGLEKGGSRIRCIVNKPGASVDALPKLLNPDSHLLSEIFQKDLILNVFNGANKCGSMIHLPLTSNIKDDKGARQRTKHAYIKPLTPGDLSSLVWTEAQSEVQSKPKTLVSNGYRNLIDVYFAPLNFKDIMQATGRLPPDAHPAGLKGVLSAGSLLGLEFAGIDENGKRVMGMVPCKALATTLTIEDEDFLWECPPGWSLEEASTVPVVYSTAYYALIVRGQLQIGETVLIHAGSGGVGLAAISICLSKKCKVYTTCGTTEKREFLLKQFPQLTNDQIFNSRSTTFEEDLMKRTNGLGVDVILNSLAEDKLQASIRCLRKCGRFLEIGKFDCVIDSKLNFGGTNARQDYTFHGVMLDNLYKYETETRDLPSRIKRDRKRISQLIVEGVKSGVVKPLPRTIFNVNKVEEAFRYMATGKHHGKVVIQIRTDAELKENLGDKSVSAYKETKFDADKSYIIIGGFGGFGLELSHWLAFKGARKILLNSRSGPTKPYHHLCLKRLKELGVNVVVSKDDATTFEGTSLILDKAENLGPVGGIFNCALVLHDAAFLDQTPETFEKVCASKLNATLHLDKLSRSQCTQLDQFVVFSSVVSGRGNIGQSNYAFSNSVAESICESRRRDSLPGLAIQWGFVGDVGYVVERMGGNEVVIRGTAAQRMHSCLAVLDRFLQLPHSTVSSLVKADSKIMPERGDLLKAISHILGIKDIHSLDPNLTLTDLGMDSLMAVEIKQALEREYEVSMSPKEIRALKISDLIEMSKDMKKTLTARQKNKTEQDRVDTDSEVMEVPEEPVTLLNQVTEGKPIFVFPPIEGNYGALEKIAGKLERPVVGINWTYDLLTHKTMEETAAHYLKVMESKSGEESYDVIGYSFGGLVALKAKECLKKSGTKRIQKLVLLDCNPEHLRAAANSRSKDEDVDPRIDLLAGAMVRVGNLNYKDVKEKLKSVSEEKREETAISVMKESGIEVKVAQRVIKGFHLLLQKMKMVQEFEAAENYEGEILHLKADEILPLTENCPVKEIGQARTFKGNHHTFISNNVESISTHIKEFLV